MKGQHVDPEEAVKIHQDLQAKRSVAIHWGTFALAYEVRLLPSLPLLHIHPSLALSYLSPFRFTNTYPPSPSYLLTPLSASPTPLLSTPLSLPALLLHIYLPT